MNVNDIEGIEVAEQIHSLIEAIQYLDEEKHLSTAISACAALLVKFSNTPLEAFGAIKVLEHTLTTLVDKTYKNL
ncbi:MAG: hypothetical protein N2V75_03990 [Methanophagales archaeon]|nr:hypothetical protein [Methanophagales archaeon]